MTDSRPDRTEETVPRGKLSWRERAILGAVCALVIGVYAVSTHSGFWESLSRNPAESYYNLLVQGFRAGQLNLGKDAPAGLTRLTDPYDPVANAHYRGAFYQLYDLSYYKGKLYLYFGVTPALLLFWPYVSLTGHYLFHRQAVAIFCVVGYLASVGVVCALWRRYFPEVSVWVTAAGALALGLASLVPVLLSRCSVYEVPISCGYMLMMLALGAIWRALHEPRRRGRWVTVASLAYGLALGARPSLLFGTVILFVPVIQVWRERQSIWLLVIAAVAPVTLAGLGLMLHNTRRFGNPLEFGLHYQLAGERQDMQRLLDPRYLWYNLHSYFFERVRWRKSFPFVTEIGVLPVPATHRLSETVFGVLIYIPLVWLGLAAPLACHHRPSEQRSVLRRFLGAVALLCGTCVFAVSMFFGATIRYEVDFLPALLLLAVAGIFAVERALADQPAWRLAARCGWGLLLGFSVVFNLLASVEHYAGSCDLLGMTWMELDKPTEAKERFEQALRIDPGYASAYNNLGLISARAGDAREAVRQYEEALRFQPDLTDARNNLGAALLTMGRVQDAIGQYEEALRLKPDEAEVHDNLGNALVRAGELEEAIGQYREVVRLQPNNREAHYNIGEILIAQGRIPEAIEQYEQALRIDPNYAEAHDKLGNALAQSGRLEDAIAHFEQAVRLEPESATAHNGLANALVLEGKIKEAIPHYEQALRINPGSATTHYNLGVAWERVGRVQEAKEHYEQALKFKPDLAAARDALARLPKGQ
jgi:tetratricopeptide (TPR) repeat protein